MTLPTHRGRGIYPRLIDAIVRAESAEADRFWIAYAPENHASGAGIRKAGFGVVAELSFAADGRPAVRAEAGGDGAEAAALGLPEVKEALAPCWRCGRAGKVHFCAPGTCTCDYQVPDEAVPRSRPPPRRAPNRGRAGLLRRVRPTLCRTSYGFLSAPRSG